MSGILQIPMNFESKKTSALASKKRKGSHQDKSSEDKTGISKDRSFQNFSSLMKSQGRKNSMMIQRTKSIDKINNLKDVRLPVEMETKLQEILSKDSFNNICMLYKFAKTASNFEKYKSLIEHLIEHKASWVKFYHQNVSQTFKYGNKLSLPIEDENLIKSFKSTELLNWILVVKPQSFRQLLYSLPEVNEYLFRRRMVQSIRCNLIRRQEDIYVENQDDARDKKNQEGKANDKSELSTKNGGSFMGSVSKLDRKSTNKLAEIKEATTSDNKSQKLKSH